MGALSGFAQGFDQSGGVKAVGQGLNTMINSPAQVNTQDIANQTNQMLSDPNGQFQQDLTSSLAANQGIIANDGMMGAPGSGATLPGMEKGGLVHPMAHPQHPVWPLLHKAAGVEPGMGPGPHGQTNAAQPAPINPESQQSARDQEPQALAKGGLVTPHPPLPANFAGASPPPKGFAAGGPVGDGPPDPAAAPVTPPFMRPRNSVDANGVAPARTLAMANGGVVAPGASVVPQHGTSMGQGITPASWEGQVQTFDGGGVVSEGMPQSGYSMMGVPGQGTPAMSGRAAGFSSGLPAGMAMGHNIMQEYQQHQARNAIENANQTGEDVWEKQYRQANGLPPMENESQGGVMDKIHSSVNNFFGLLGFHSHDQEGNRPNPSLQQGATPGAVSSPSGNAAPPTGAGIPAGGAPAGAPAPAAAPAGGAPGAPAPAAAPAGAPPGGAAPPAAAAPPSPSAIAGAKAAQVAGQTTGNPQQAAATGQAVASGIASAQADAAAGKGADAVAPPKASMDPRDIIALERAKMRAANAATAAGMDGTKVYSALSAQQTAHFQSEYLNQIGRAQQALQAGDMDSMKKFVRNANYFLPNGQDLEFKTASQLPPGTAPQGVAPNTPMITNPFFGMPGHQQDPQYVPLNGMSLQGFATAAFDPRAFAQGQMEMYKAGVSAQSELMKGQAAQAVGRGREWMGQAAVMRAQVEEAFAPSKINLNNANADKAEAWASHTRDGTGGGFKTTAASARAAANDGQKAFADAAQGELGAQPAEINGIPNPRSGQSFRDPSKIAPIYQGLKPDQIERGKALAASLNASNQRSLTAPESAELAARIVRDQDAAKGGKLPTHINPQTGKEELNVVRDTDTKGNPTIHVWNGTRYINAYTTPNLMSADEEASARGINTGGGAGGGSQQESDDDNAPAEETEIVK